MDDRPDKPTSLMGPDELAELTVKGAERSATATPVAKGSDRLARRPAAPTLQVDPEEISGLIELAEVMVSQKPAEVVPLAADDKKTRKMDAEQFRALLAPQDVDTEPVPTVLASEMIEQSRAEPATTTPVPNARLKELAAQTEPKPRTITTTAEMLAQVDEAFADFGPEPESEPTPLPPPAPEPDDDLAIPTEVMTGTESRPVKKPALIVPDHRLETRFVGAIAPITKPPQLRDPAPREVAAAPPIDKPRAPSPIEVAHAGSASTLVLISLLAVAILVGILAVLLRF